MRTLLFLIFITTSAFGQDFDTRFKALEEGRDKTLMDWRMENEFELPNDNYVETYRAEWGKFIEAQRALHQELCTGSTSCPPLTQLDSQARIAVGVLQTRNRSAHEGKTSDREQAEAETYFRSCAEQNLNCDKLSTAEKNLAEAARTPSSSESTTPEVTTPEVTTPEVTNPEVTTPEETVNVASTGENEDERNPKNYVPETCEWVTDLPRKIVNGPGCGPRSRSRICTGYVKCKQKDSDAYFVRMSTCAPENCGNDDAVACTKDMRYYSGKAQGEEKLFMSKKLKNAVTGSEQ